MCSVTEEILPPRLKIIRENPIDVFWNSLLRYKHIHVMSRKEAGGGTGGAGREGPGGGGAGGRIRKVGND